jgi:hypothetical protein
MASRKKILLFQFSFIMVMVGVIEIVMRLVGHQPGDLRPRWLNFAPVDTLTVIPDFVTNSEGLVVANKDLLKGPGVFINVDGFRNKEFAQIDSAKKKVLLIGDSFTWGLSAKPLDSCFADILQRETDYEIINLGIPVADPPQYLALAQKYVLELKPDLILVVFFMGNDLMIHDRLIAPYKAVYHHTNAGAIYADIDGKHFATPEKAYRYVTTEKYYLHHPANIFEKIVNKSALLSRLYSLRFRMMEKKAYEQAARNSGVSKKYLEGIMEVAQQNEVLVRFVLIPEIKEVDISVEKYTEKYADLLKDSSLKDYWLIPQNENSYFNDYPDAHLNNKGHRFYGDYIKSFLKKDFERL